MEDIQSSQPPTVGNWFITLFVLALPLIGLIMALYWAFASGVNAAKRNLCRAALLWMAISIGFFIVLSIFGGLATMMGGGAESF